MRAIFGDIQSSIGEFRPFLIRDWKIVAFPYTMGVSSAIRDILISAHPPFFVQVSGESNEREIESLEELITLLRSYDAAPNTYGVDRDEGVAFIFTQVDGYALIAIDPGKLVDDKLLMATNQDFIEKQSKGELWIGFGEDGRNFVVNDLIPIINPK